MTTTRLSSKGQIVIPEAIRRRLGLDPGSEFVVLGDGDTIVLQRVRPPAMRDFDTIVARARQAAPGRDAPVRRRGGDRRGALDLLAVAPYQAVTVLRPRDFLELLSGN